MASVAESAFEAIVEAFAGDAAVTPPAPSRREFGSNGVKAHGRIFAMLVRGDLVVKLPAARVDALVSAGRGARFDAGKGRPMKEWLVVAPGRTLRATAEPWLALAREARDFVAVAAPRRVRVKRA